MTRCRTLPLLALLWLGLLAPVVAHAAPEPGGQFGFTSGQTAVTKSYPPPASLSLRASSYPLNGGFLLLNMHGLLFHEQARDFEENVAYARWMQA